MMNKPSEFTFLKGQGVSTELPKFDVFDATCDQLIILVRVELDIKYLSQKEKQTGYVLMGKSL